MRKSYLAAPPPPPPTLNVDLSVAQYAKYVTGPGNALFDFTITASGGDGGPYTFNVGFGDVVAAGSVSFQLELSVANGSYTSAIANGSAHDASGTSGESNPVYYVLVSNPV